MLCTHVLYYLFSSVKSMAKSLTANVVLAKSISPLMFSPADEGMHEDQERIQQMESSPNNLDVCTMCNSTAILFDVETSETVCSSCGTVLTDKTDSQWKAYSGDDIESKSRTGMPTCLAFHDMGLSTFISYSNVDANGGAISPDQISKVQRMRHWNKISNNNRSLSQKFEKCLCYLKQCKR